LSELADFKKENGHCNVHTNAVNRKLGTWVHHQRRQYKLFKEGQPCHITEERIRALDDLGFVWRPRDTKRSSSEQDDDSAAKDDDSAASDGSSSGSGEEIVLADYDFRPSKRQRCASPIE
jgi:Helicase associated domain